jgi:hypothetical protein
MILDDVINRAIPIYDKDCPGGKCERDCRLSVDYKKHMRIWLKKQIQEYAKQFAERGSFSDKLNYDKK